MSYTEYSAFHVTTRAGVAHVTFDHPPINLLDVAMVTELNRFVAAVRDDDNVRVIVFQSANPEFFLAHADMTWLTTEGLYAKLAEAETTLSPLNPLQRLHERLRSLPQVTIAKISGFARCGGSEFTMALDMRFAAKGKAGLAQSEVLMGIFPGGGGTAYPRHS